MSTRNRILPKIKGTKKLVLRNQLIISLGLPALDIMIGGGLPVGNIFLIQNDESGYFTKFVVQYYLAEGVMNEHQLLIASLDERSEHMVELPDPLVVPAEKLPSTMYTPRTKPLRKVDAECKCASVNQEGDASSAFGNTYGLSIHRGMMCQLKRQVKIHHWKCPRDTHRKVTDTYENLYEFIEKTLEDKKLSFNLSSQERTILRIAIISIGTGLWTGNIHRFLIRLRFLLRNVYATCVISIQPGFFDKKDMDRIEHLCDTVIRLNSFYDRQRYQETRDDWDGLVILKKLSTANNWTPMTKNTDDDWAFKLRKGSRFILRRLHELVAPSPTKRTRTEDDDDRS